MDNPERVTYFAATDSRGKRVPFGIKAKDRGRHMYVIGKTGMGKSNLLENMAIQDIRNGEGLAFIDPHGSAVDKLLDYVPEERIKDVVYFAPFDLDNPIAFNVMEDVGYDKRHLVVSGLMATFKKIWVDAWSARMEYILTNTLLALLEYPDATLLGVNRMYTDKKYRDKVIDNVKDPIVKDFWTREFATFTDTYTREATPAIQNKIGQFTGNPLIRNIIGQPKSSFDIRTMMDQRKILLINLSKGLVGDTNMKLLGSMLTTRIFLGAMSRAELSEGDLKKSPKFYFYVDEFQNFANETFSEILSEARKYNLNLLIAHQYVEQMEEEVAAAVFGNVGTTVAFRVGPFDAEKLEVVFAPEFETEDLVNLGFAQVYLSLMIDGVGSRPFSAVTLPPIEKPARVYRAEIIAASRKQFANPRATVESSINAELQAVLEAPVERVPVSLERARRRPPASGASAPPMDRRPPPVRVERSQPRFSAPSAQTAPTPVPESSPRRTPLQQKTVADLKGILRTVADKSASEKQKSGNDQKQSLKNTLADVLKRNPVPAPKSSQPKPTATQPQEERRENQPVSPPKPKEGPYEVSEEELRRVLRGEN